MLSKLWLMTTWFMLEVKAENCTKQASPKIYSSQNQDAAFIGQHYNWYEHTNSPNNLDIHIWTISTHPDIRAVNHAANVS